MYTRSLIVRRALFISALGATIGVGHAGAQTPTTEELWEIIQKQQEMIEALQAKVGETEEKIEAAGEMIDQAASGDDDPLHWGGYGELHYNAGDTREIDVHRFVFFTEYEFNDKLRLQSEFEIEHALSGDGNVPNGSAGKPGEVEIEQAFIEWDVGEAQHLYGGVHLVPAGLLNETHEPPTFFGVERNRVESEIIPTTWWEAGVGANGEIGDGLKYDLFVHSGLQTPVTGTSAFRIRSGRQKVAEASATDPAATGRIQWNGMPGVNLGASLQYQADLTQTADIDGDGRREEIDAWLYTVNADILVNGWGLRALYAEWDIDGGATGIGPSSVGRDDQWGYYIEPSYRFTLPNAGANGDAVLGIFTRYGKFDSQAGDNTDSEEQQFDVGFNYWLHPDVVIKGDYNQVSVQEGTGADRLNLGIGWQF